MDASTIPRETSREAASLSVDEGWIAVGTILKWHSCITSYGVFLFILHLILSKVGVSGLLGVFHRLALTDETSLTHETSKGEVGGVGEGFGVVLRADKGGNFLEGGGGRDARDVERRVGADRGWIQNERVVV